MASYDPSPQDEGYSEAPLTVGTGPGSANLQTWIASLPVAKRIGKIPRNCEVMLL
jgi:F-box and WD-40 domain protein 1/11